MVEFRGSALFGSSFGPSQAEMGLGWDGGRRKGSFGPKLRLAFLPPTTISPYEHRDSDTISSITNLRF